MTAFPFFKKTKQNDKPLEKMIASSLALKEEESSVSPKKEGAIQPVLVEAKQRTQRKKMNIREDAVLVRPVFTEKTMQATEKNTYSFEVDIRATKLSVKKAIFNVYGYMPIQVRMMIRKGKAVRFGARKGTRKDVKYAFVALKKGEKIDVLV